jgi:hypothetical protein
MCAVEDATPPLLVRRISHMVKEEPNSSKPRVRSMRCFKHHRPFLLGKLLREPVVSRLPFFLAPAAVDTWRTRLTPGSGLALSVMSGQLPVAMRLLWH